MTEVSVVRMGVPDGRYFLVAVGDGDGASHVVARCESEALAVKLAEVLRVQVPDADLADLMERASWGVRTFDTPDLAWLDTASRVMHDLPIHHG